MFSGPSVRRSTRSTSVSSSDSVVKIKQTPDLGSKRLPESSSASSSVQKTTHTPGPTKTLKQGRKLALQTPSGEKQSSKSKSKKVDDSAIPKGYKLKETIKSTVPCYVKSDSHGNCICNYPLRSCTDELSHDEGFSDPMKCFDFFFDELIQTLTLESNKYAISRGFKHEIVCESEMRAFIGIIINSMYMKASDRSYYWSRDRDTGIAGVRDLMSRNRFDELIKCVHFRDNREMPADNTDKFFKVRPLFQILNQKLEVFQNCENISVDESMVPYFGFHGAKQYMKGKPHKFGFKVWVATSPTGVPLFCEPYAGASTDMPDYGMKKSSDIVAHIITRLGLGAGHKVYADNYFMSPALLKWCTEKNIGLTGTLRKNRLRDVPYPPVEAAVGSYKSVVDTENNIIYTAWQDRKCVLAASNCFSCEPLRTVTVGRGQTKEKSKPDLIVEYNANMGGVDLLDFWLSVYRPRIRSRKWYWPLFTWVLGVLLVSAWKLWSNHSAAEKNENKMSFLSYIRKVNYGIRQGFPEKEHHHQPRDLLTGRIDNRFSDNAHLIDEDKDKQFVCRSCRELEGKKSRTQFFCTICRVGLHPRCFRRYHDPVGMTS